MVHVITVAPAESGWTVNAEAFEPMVFLSGAKAEAAARRLADKIAAGGDAAEIRIFLRDGALAARFARPAALPLAS